MGTMSFLLPRGAPAAALPDLDRACIAGGYDNMPAPTQVLVEPDRLRLVRDVDESGYLVVPWEVNGAGRVMTSSATLIERPEPYSVGIELARGKLNQLRCQTADWQSLGLAIPESLETQIRTASHHFGLAATSTDGAAADAQARTALELGYHAAGDLIRTYVDQMYRARHQKQPQLDTSLGVRLTGAVPPAAEDAVASAVNSAALPLTWRAIEPTESQYHWEESDARLDWATRRNLTLTGGPLIDFSTFGLPDWLWLWEGDLPSLSSFMCDYVETAVGRYHRKVRRWQLTAASNNANVLKLGEDDLLWLTARLAEAAWQVDPDLELVVGIAQPWGEYMAREEHTYSPFIFADTLIRAGLKLAALDVEWVMGVAPRGSYCRDLLDASRVLDLYQLLCTPLHVTLAYPSADGPDPLADAAYRVAAGNWQGGWSPDVQGDWAYDYATLAACKPFVKAVTWAQLTDGETHQFPHCGLLDSAGRPKPALGQLRLLREQHLR
jgi:Glycosyl hydrolase family 10